MYIACISLQEGSLSEMEKMPKNHNMKEQNNCKNLALRGGVAQNYFELRIYNELKKEICDAKRPVYNNKSQ